MKMHDVQRPPTRPQRYEAPTSIEHAVALLAQAGDSARLIAGGSDLLVELDRGAHNNTDLLIDISRVPGLDVIDGTADGGLRVGAAVTHNQVVADERCRVIALPLAQACLEVGSPQLRNRATVVGNIVTASPANDTIGPLMVLGATVEIVGPRGTRTQPVAEFITGFRKTSLGPGEIVTGLVIPGKAANTRSMFVKAGLRRAQAISVANATVLVRFEDDGSTVGSATVALGSVAPTVIEVRLDQYLAGTSLDADSIDLAARAAAQAASPIDDLRSSAEYRLRMVEVMVRRAL
ncbi:MAG: xanthine dehydrogenase family protein subunit M, partial [Acidimicrobiales bacterium]|nr:xanthine dehydrogenase family protein subunit M [Acidimicrobiales bacterium]